MLQVTRVYFLILMLFITSIAKGQVIDIEKLEEIETKAKDGDPKSMFLLGVVLEEGKYQRQNLKKAFQLYKNSAEAGYDSAFYNLGKMYELGTGVSQNYPMAFAYFSKLEDKDHAEAIFRLGTLYEYGAGVEESKSKAVSLYLKSLRLGYKPAQTKIDNLPIDSLANRKDVSYVYYKANQGDAVYQYVVGKMFEEGVGLGKNLENAFNYYTQSSVQEYPRANVAIGDMYAKGKFVKRNERLAAKHYLKAAIKGDEEAKSRLATIDLNNSVDPNSIEYLEYISTLDSEKAGNAVELYKLHKKFWYGQGVNIDYERSIDYLQKAAEQDYPPAYMKLGDLYYKGIGVPQDYATAFKYFKEAFILKNDSALFILGDMYARGLGVERNEGKAVKYFLTAGVSGTEMAILRLQQYDVLKYVSPNDLRYVKYLGLRGDVQAQLAAAKYHMNKNEGEAIRWLRDAANNRNSEAQVLLGQVFYEGRCNMPIDNDEAQKWFTLAAQQKNLDAFRFMADMYSKNLISTSTGGGSKDPGEQLEYAFQMANEYLRLKKGKLDKEDAIMYKIMGKIYYEREDYPNAVNFMTDFVNNYDASLHTPMNLIEALETRATAYTQMKNYSAAIIDLELAMSKLEGNKADESVKYDYRHLSGYLVMEKAKVYFAEGNLFKACNTVQQALKMGVKVEKQYIDICMKN